MSPRPVCTWISAVTHWVHRGRMCWNRAFMVFVCCRVWTLAITVCCRLNCKRGYKVLNEIVLFADLDSELASVLTAIGKNPSIKSLNMTRSFVGMKIKHIATVMDSLVGLIQKDDFPLTELILSENKLKNDIHDFINALGSNQSLQKLGKDNLIRMY